MKTENITSWRQLADYLTPAQVQSFTRREAKYPGLPAELLVGQARAHVEGNRIDQERFGHVPDPVGATYIWHWQVDRQDGGWRREFEGRDWHVGRLTAHLCGQQLPDASVTARVGIDCPTGEEFSAEDLRRIAAALCEAADELETITR